MKFRHANPSNIKQLVPEWIGPSFGLASALERMLSNDPNLSDGLRRKEVGLFWNEGGECFRLPDSHGGKFVIDGQSPYGGSSRLIIPAPPLLKGSPRIGEKHLLYVHTICTDVPMSYVGLTRQRWHERYSQHQSASSRGSSLVFHRALREHADIRKQHAIIYTDLSFDEAMRLEEVGVSLSLYPLGMNMIPGGYAGMKYLHKLGVTARGLDERDKAVERLSSIATVNGRINPLCAARWESDQDFVNRIICGHSGRLSVEQVRSIRLLADFGLDRLSIAERVGVSSPHRVKNIIAGVRYGRVA